LHNGASIAFAVFSVEPWVRLSHAAFHWVWRLSSVLDGTCDRPWHFPRHGNQEG